MKANSFAKSGKGGSPPIFDGIRLDNTVITPTRYEDFKLKAIVSGNLVELYLFEIPLLINYSKKKASGSLRDRTEEYKERTANKGSFLIRRLLHSNFKKYDKFISLTFNDDNDFDIKDLKACNKIKSEFLAKLKRNVKKNLKYVIVPEFQDKNGRGAVHYHIVCDLPFIEKEEFAKYWPYGFFDIRSIENIDKQAFYLTKYITKNKDDSRFSENKSYFTSRGLDRSAPIYGRAAGEVLGKVKNLRLKATRTGEFDTKFNGKAKFREYLLPDKESSNEQS